MIKSSDLQDIAIQMLAARSEVRQIEPFTSRMGDFDLSHAYAVAHLIHEAQVSEGAFPVGRKIGFTNPDMWAIYGVREPIWSYIYDKTVKSLPGAGGICSVGGFTEPKIEPEIVFHFHSAPPVGGGLADILKSIDWVAHAFEIVQSHFPGWRFQAADTVVDCALHGTLLLGEPVPVDHLGPDPVETLKNFSLTLSRNGEILETGKGSNVLGSPLVALAHLMEVLSRQPESLPLQGGEIVTTGTITTAQAVRAGETWQTTLHGASLSGLTVEFVS